jgi:hypothetical protein
MDKFEQILEDCLDNLSSGASSLDECLSRYPEQAPLLRPLLQTAAGLQSGSQVQPSPTYRANARVRLAAHMQAHPGRRSQPALKGWRLAANLAVLTIAVLLTGTGFAQRALPGSPLYGWKLTSENVWRGVSYDRASTDLAISKRRADEMVSIGKDSQLSHSALEKYQEVLARLLTKKDADWQARILPILESQQESFKQAGLSVPELDDYLQSDHPAAPSLPEASPTKVKKPREIATPSGHP